MATHQTDVVVIGAGPAGYVCAIRLAQLGKKVIVVEKANVGGVCLNVGCIPSKALIHAGTVFDRTQHADEMGISIKGATLDMKKLMTWKGEVVKKLTGGVGQLLKANGCTLLAGEAKFTSATTLEVKTASGTDSIQFKQAVIATGSRPAKIPGFDVDQELVLDSTGGLSQDTVPATMLCVGGGYIGLELGTFYSKVGSKVTVVEASPSLLGIVDPDLVRVVQKNLQKRGVEIMTSTMVKGVKKNAKSVEVTFSSEGGEKKQTFDRVLVTIGRTPNTENLGLDRAGVKIDSKGFIPVNERRQTSVPSIYAIGDVAGQPLLAHKGSKEGMVAAEAIGGLKTVYDVKAMPAVVFTDPEIATVGLTEAEAKAKGLSVTVGVFPYAANGRALSVAEPDGMVKLVSDSKKGTLLGCHIVGAEASNLIAEATLAIEMGAHVEDLALTVHAHPTLPETIMEAAEVALGHPIHIFKPKK
ncbi:MAG: dihydrolipoyl dehydrogenase [Bdellovibrionales bacterium]|nr:dihydrolipoyl dehydrogenase [Bdellovibrionales bacterium]